MTSESDSPGLIQKAGTPPIEIIPLEFERETLENVSGLFRTVWPGARHMTGHYLDWAYRQNPNGRAIGFNGVCQGKVVAHYAVQPIQALVYGNEEPGALSLNTAVHPDFRGTGIFQKMAKATYAKAQEAGLRFIVGVANAMSAPLFWRVLKFQPVGSMEVWIGFGSPRVSRENKFSIGYQRVWSSESLKWRVARPGNPYRFRKTVDGIVIYSPTDYPGVYADLGFFCANGSEIGVLPLKTKTPLRVWAGLDPRRAGKFFGRISVPMRWRPSPLHVIFKDLTQQKRILKKQETLFSLLDFDAY